jgi:hypothetical protein
LQAVGRFDAVIVAPLLAGTVRAGDHQAVQHGEEDGALGGKFEAAISQQFVQHLAAAGVAPEPLEQQRRADALATERRHTGFVDQRQDHRALGEASGGAGQAVEVAATFDVFFAAEIADDALLDLAILADGLDQVDVGIAADALFTDEHGASILPDADSSSQKRLVPVKFGTTYLKIGGLDVKNQPEINALMVLIQTNHALGVKGGPERSHPSPANSMKRWLPILTRPPDDCPKSYANRKET